MRSLTQYLLCFTFLHAALTQRYDHRPVGSRGEGWSPGEHYLRPGSGMTPTLGRQLAGRDTGLFLFRQICRHRVFLLKKSVLLLPGKMAASKPGVLGGGGVSLI